MGKSKNCYDHFVPHPRYGKGPRLTGLNPELDGTGRLFFHWHSARRIENTAVAADLAKQPPACIPVTHYFDVIRQCRDCQRSFIFFALEQKYWYEELGFVLDADCDRCVPCRKQQQGLQRQRERYEALFHQPHRSVSQNLEMATCCLALIQAGLFSLQQSGRVRMLLKRVMAVASGEELAIANRLWQVLLGLEKA